MHAMTGTLMSKSHPLEVFSRHVRPWGSQACWQMPLTADPSCQPRTTINK